MKKYIRYTLLLVPFVFVYACSSEDDDPVVPPVAVPSIDINLTASFETGRYSVVEINPDIDIKNADNLEVSYIWSITSNDKDSVISDQKVLKFISPRSGKYDVSLTVACGETSKKASTSVSVSTDDNNYSNIAGTVIEYSPAPDFSLSWGGIFAVDEADVLAQAQDAMTNDMGIYLGNFGGYVITKFDHTVINTYNQRDLLIEMDGSLADVKKFNTPVVVMVAYDANKNGIADADEWYEIAGSEHHKSTTIRNYEITYFRPDAGKEPVAGIHDWEYDTQYLKWSSNKNETGYITQTSFGVGTDYYPAWKPDSYTLKGTKLAIPVKDISDGDQSSWNVGTFDWGYGGIKDSRIDISWAVDKDGNKVYLPGVDFIKVYVPTFSAIGDWGYLTSIFKSAKDINLISEDQ